MLAGCGEPPPPPLSDAAVAERLTEAGEKLTAAIRFNRPLGSLGDDVDAVLAERPDDVAALTLRGQIHMSAGEVEPAAACFARALERAPDQKQLWLLTGGLRSTTGDWSGALDAYTRARDLDPADAESHVKHANALLKLGRLDDAEAGLAAALARNARSHASHALRAGLLEARGDDDAALRQWELALSKTLAHEPKEEIAYAKALSRRLLRRDRPGDAARVLRIRSVDHFFTPELMALHAEALDAAGLPDLAADYYDRWYKRAPDNAHAIEHAARWSLAAGDRRRASAYVVALRRVAPEHAALAELDAAIGDTETR